MESIGDVIGKFVDMNKFNAMTDKVIARPEIEKFISDNKMTSDEVSKSYSKFYEYLKEKNKFDNGDEKGVVDLHKIQKNGEILKKYLSSISLSTLNTLFCFYEMSNVFSAVERLEDTYNNIVANSFDGMYLIKKLKQRTTCLRILYGMKKCGQVTYAKQLSAALEQEGIELTL